MTNEEAEKYKLAIEKESTTFVIKPFEIIQRNLNRLDRLHERLRTCSLEQRTQIEKSIKNLAARCKEPNKQIDTWEETSLLRKELLNKINTTTDDFAKYMYSACLQELYRQVLGKGSFDCRMNNQGEFQRWLQSQS